MKLNVVLEDERRLAMRKTYGRKTSFELEARAVDIMMTECLINARAICVAPICGSNG
ncbi:hypothetical protein [Stenomitos frigidus]|uniref:hypothetical protein n=1 Tax=Stenomitos frigidus TaxID=1886765 RepID=UPI0015E7C95A|nr:hypothetical protein [Stenomitos frigidus]